MAKINENNMAKNIAQLECGRTSVNIAQIKEVLEITLDILAAHWQDGNEIGVIELLKKHQG